MNTNFQCQYCGKENEISEALTHQIQEEVLIAERLKHQSELEQAKKDAEEKARNKVKGDFEQQMKELTESTNEEKERNRKLLQQLSELTTDIRALRRKDEERELEMQKKLAEGEEKIRTESRRQTLDEHELKDKEKDKKLTDALRQIEELKIKMQQGSQQAQGEVLEIELEDILKREFPLDLIKEVKKFHKGADITHEVIDRNGANCGMILWESKNAVWQNEWIEKLKENKGLVKAHVAVLVATDPPAGVDGFVYQDGIWIATRKMAACLALALRYDLIRVDFERSANTGKNEKMEVLYQYITSVEFVQRIDSITRAFRSQQEDLEKEKRWFTAKWARQEKQLGKIIDNTLGMYGDLQGLIGKSLPEIQALQIEAGDESISIEG